MTNNEIKLLKSLSQKKYRNKHKQYIIEGLRIVEELFRSKTKPIKILTTNEFLDNNPKIKLKISNFKYEIINEKYFCKILNTNNPQHIMALLSTDQIELFVPSIVAAIILYLQFFNIVIASDKLSLSILDI